MSFHIWLTTAWTNLLHWFGVKEQKIASFLYPIFQDAKQIVEKDVLKDIIAGVPVVAAALASGPAGALAAAEAFIVPLITAQGIQIATTTLATLSNALVAQAQASLAAVTPAADAPVVPGSAAEIVAATPAA